MASKSDTLTVTDNRTGQTYEIPISDGAIPAIDLRQIKVTDDDFGLLSYDPAFQNTATCHSEITYIDGDRGILEYRGYPIQDLAARRSYLEVAYLLLFGELPGSSELDAWQRGDLATGGDPRPNGNNGDFSTINIGDSLNVTGEHPLSKVQTLHQGQS